MLAESRDKLADALTAWMPEGVAVFGYPPDTAAPPFVYLAPARHSWRQGAISMTWDVSLVIDGGLAPASRALELDRLFDLVLAACADVSILADCSSSFGTQLLGDIGHPRATVSVPMFHAVCELPQPAPVPEFAEF